MQYLISRHIGAIDWCQRQHFAVDQILAHLDPSCITQGDVVIGTLPLPIVADIQRRGARYVHLSVNLPAELRGQELSAEQLDSLGASLQEFHVTLVGQ